MAAIRPGVALDIPALMNIWRRSVEATHTFLSPTDVDALEPEGQTALGMLKVWVATVNDTPAGFMAMNGHMIEALFIDPDHMGKKLGTSLIEHARTLRGRDTELRLDVNEANTNALGFYLARGFKQIGRSETDSAGRPWPLLHLALPPG